MKTFQIILQWNFKHQWHYTLRNTMDVNRVELNTIKERLRIASKATGLPWILYEIEVSLFRYN